MAELISFLWQQRADYVVPCSTQSQFPDLWSATLRCAHWMPILGDPGAHAVGVPSRHGDPREDHGEALPQPRRGQEDKWMTEDKMVR